MQCLHLRRPVPVCRAGYHFLSLNKGVKYDEQKQAYIDHTAGSVILIKSTNTEITLDAAYETKHGLFVTMENGAVWNVTGESRISGLTFTDDCTINGTIMVDGEAVEAAGEYAGDIVIVPAE